MEKQCSKCKIVKPLNDFHNLQNGKNGKHSNCKKCRSEYQKSLFYEKPINGKMKCSKCHVLKSINEYYRDKSASTGIQSYCIECHKEKIYESQSKLIGYLKREIQSKNKTENSIINLDDILQIYKNQNGRCALSDELLTYYNGPKLTENSYESKYNINIIRKDLSKIYNVENIILIGKCINQMKGNKTLDEFIQLCSIISNKNN